MPVFFNRIAGGVLAIGLLAACSGLNLGTAAALKNLDPIADDVAGMTIAIDVPRSIRPVDQQTLLVMDATTKGFGERHVRAVLVRNEDFRAAASLSPPATNRTYYLFALDQSDQKAVRELQQWARDLKNRADDVGGELTIRVQSRFCRLGQEDAGQEVVSVYVSAPDSPRLNPLLHNVGISQIGDQSSTGISPCSAV